MGKAMTLTSQFLWPPGTSYLFWPSCSKPISLERPWPLEGRPQQVQRWQTNESGTSDKVLRSKCPCTSLFHAEQSKEGDKWPLVQCMDRLFITCQKHWPQEPINRWCGLLTAVHTYNRTLFDHERNSILVYVTLWLDLENFRLSERSQTQTVTQPMVPSYGMTGMGESI